MPLHRLPLVRLLVALGLGLATFGTVRSATARSAGAGRLVEVVTVAPAGPGRGHAVSDDVRTTRLPAGRLGRRPPGRGRLQGQVVAEQDPPHRCWGDPHPGDASPRSQNGPSADTTSARCESRPLTTQ